MWIYSTMCSNCIFDFINLFLHLEAQFANDNPQTRFSLKSVQNCIKFIFYSADEGLSLLPSSNLLVDGSEKVDLKRVMKF